MRIMRENVRSVGRQAEGVEDEQKQVEAVEDKQELWKFLEEVGRVWERAEGSRCNGILQQPTLYNLYRNVNFYPFCYFSVKTLLLRGNFDTLECR